MNEELIINSLEAGTLEFECPNITLTQNSDDNKIQYSGPGRISQDESGNIRFKIYSTSLINACWADVLKRAFDFRAGQVIPDTSYYSLTATTISGAEWTGHGILPHINCSAENFALVYGNINSIFCIHDSNTDHILSKSYYFDRVELPRDRQIIEENGRLFYTQDSVERQFRDFKMHAKFLESHFYIELSSDTPISESTTDYIQRSFEFTLARQLVRRAHIAECGKTQFRKLELYSKGKPLAPTQFKQPLMINSGTNHQNFWDLFEKYFEYLAKPLPTHNGQCCWHLGNARDATANSIDAWIIGLCVAVEGISNLVPKDILDNSKINIKDLKDYVIQKIRLRDDFSIYENRLGGFISSMNNPRTIDILSMLSQNGFVDKEYISSWNKLRNRHVHPTPSQMVEIYSGDMQKIFDQISDITTLMYQVVFYLVGYKGQFTDYGVAGYPLSDYPLPPSYSIIVN